MVAVGGGDGGRKRGSKKRSLGVGGALPPVVSDHYRMRHRVPKVDLDLNPFCIERQMNDQLEQIRKNRNPRRWDLTHGDDPRSATMVAKKNKVEDDLSVFKSRVIRQALADVEEGGSSADGAVSISSASVHKALRTPVIQEDNWIFQQSTQGIMKSFGHRPSSASRTFNPVKMGVDPIRPHRDSHTKTFMTSTTLYHLLHPPSYTTNQQHHQQRASLSSPSQSMTLSTLSLEPTATMTRPDLHQAQDNRMVEDEAPANDDERPKWDPTFHTVHRKYFSHLSSLQSSLIQSSAEKLSRYHQVAAGTDVPEMFRERYERDREYMRTLSGTFFPKNEPQLIGEPPILSPRTYDSNQYIKRILRARRDREEELQRRVQDRILQAQWDKIPKVPPLRLP